MSFCVCFEDCPDGRSMLPSYEPFIVEQTDAPCISTITFAKDAVDINAEGKEIGQFDNAGSNHAVYLLPDGGYKW